MKFIIGSVCALFLVACSPAVSGTPEGAKLAHTEAAPSVVSRIDTSSGSIAGLRAGMTKDQLIATGLAINERSLMLEGDEYVVLDVSLHEGLVVECWLDEGRIRELRTAAEGMKDEKGVGVGSSLAALRSAYPSGRLVTGEEDGRRYANFVNRSKVVFEMDIEVLPKACFDNQSAGCDARQDVRVRSVVVYSGPST